MNKLALGIISVIILSMIAFSAAAMSAVQSCTKNKDCRQSPVTTCDGFLLGTSLGKCVDHVCVYDNFKDFKCNVEKCGASCDENKDCKQSTTGKCNEETHQLQVRDNTGSCSTKSCTCTEDQFKLECVKGNCGATCSNDFNCIQDVVGCVGTKVGFRDFFGECTDGCQCKYDDFSHLRCVKDQCKAQCSNDKQCDDGDSTTQDSCNADCGCVHDKTVPEFGVSAALVALVGAVLAFVIFRRN